MFKIKHKHLQAFKIWLALLGYVRKDLADGGVMDVQKEQEREEFEEKMCHKLVGVFDNALNCYVELTDQLIWETWQAAKAQAVPEGFDYKKLYKLAIINSKTDKSKPNWAHVVSLGVGSGKAKEILRSFNIDPEAVDMRNMIEAQERN